MEVILDVSESEIVQALEFMRMVQPYSANHYNQGMSEPSGNIQCFFCGEATHRFALYTVRAGDHGDLTNSSV